MAMRIGDVASQVGLATSALRYYEKAGLLPAAARSESGYRLYGTEVIGRIAFIQRAQALGLSIGDIRQLLSSPAENSPATRSRLRHVVAHKLAATERRLAELDELKRELQALYVRLARAPGPDCGHLGDCACWLPTQKEVMAMSKEIEAVQACSCCGCPDPGCDCGCDCCGCPNP